MTYPLFPRSLDSAGRTYCGIAFGIEKAGRSYGGMRSARSTRPKSRHFVDLAWEGVSLDTIEPLEALVESTLGVGLIVAPSYRCDTRLTQAYSSGTNLIVDRVSPFTAYSLTITDSVNDRLDFSIDGVTELVAVLTPGTYTPDTLAAHIEAAMEAEVTGPQYTVTWSLNDDRFTIAEDQVNGTPAGQLELWLFTGSSSGRSVGSTLGFDVSRDREGALSYSSQFFKAPYGSRILLADRADGFATTHLFRVTSTSEAVTGPPAFPPMIQIASATGHTYAIGSIVEPVFNASFGLQDEDGEMRFGVESSKGLRRIVSTSVRLEEEFNA